MLSFAWPWALVLLPTPWLMLRALRRTTANDQNIPVVNFPKLKRLQLAFAKASAVHLQATKWQKALTALMWGLLVIALMRPEFINGTAHSNNLGYDLMLAVDLSRSMEMADFSDSGQPMTRIGATKKVVANFVQQRTGDRVGLIVFAEQAFLTIPLTLDTIAVSKLLNNLLVGMAGERTAIGDAIGIAVQNLRKRPESSRVLILLTDGEDTASHIPPLEAAKIAHANKIKIYTIGVGNKLDEDLLEKIATMTGGAYFKVTNVNSLEKVYAKIDSLEKSEAAQKLVLIKSPLYQWFLIAVLILFIIAYVGRVRLNGYESRSV